MKVIPAAKKGKLSDLTLIAISIALFYLFGGSQVSNMNYTFAIVYTTFTFLRYINNLGHSINIFDFLAFYSALDSLLSPLIAYKYFNKSDSLASLWGAYMRVPEDVYYAYLIPANLALFAGLNFIFYKRKLDAVALVDRAKAYVANKSKIGFFFVGVGVMASQLVRSVPGSITFIFYMMSMMSYVGGFYVYFSVKKRRNLIIGLLFALFFLVSVQKGLFGEFAMFSVMASSVVMLQYRFSFFSKLLFFVIAISCVMVIQSVKAEYRLIVWNGQSSSEYAGQGNLEVFSGLITEKLNSPKDMFNEKDMFFLNRRINQGFLISMAMNYVPRIEPYADGETIWLSLAAVAVPRFLWPEKPESGGHMNLARFVGIKRRLNYSMNIGPYGEGYGNFGPTGGVVFIFIYAALIAFFLDRVLSKCRDYPSLIIWLPFLFYYVLTVETDILTTLNSFVKMIIFLTVIYWVAKKFFKIDV